MAIDFRRIREDDCNEVLAILNHYVRSGFHAYPEEEFDLEHFGGLFFEFRDYPNLCCTEDGKVVGFGYLKPFRKFKCFNRTAEITYFISPDYTGKGLGSKMLAEIISSAKETGIKVIIAHISSLNERSINFHLKHGFEKCGHFKNVVEKNGEVFDMVWMQKEL